jgi:hypothetical protein
MLVALDAGAHSRFVFWRFECEHGATERRSGMGLVRAVVATLFVAAGLALPATAAQAPSIKGGGATAEMTQFALAITAGRGHLECLMPALMNVQATVTGVTVTGASSAAFEGTAFVTLPAGNPLGLPPGRIGPAPFTATATAGGPGVGQLDLKIMGMDFPGTVEHGQIQIGT